MSETRDTVAKVVRMHSIVGMSGGVQVACRCDRRWVTFDEYDVHLTDMLVVGLEATS